MDDWSDDILTTDYMAVVYEQVCLVQFLSACFLASTLPGPTDYFDIFYLAMLTDAYLYDFAAQYD